MALVAKEQAVEVSKEILKTLEMRLRPLQAKTDTIRLMQRLTKASLRECTEWATDALHQWMHEQEEARRQFQDIADQGGDDIPF